MQAKFGEDVIGWVCPLVVSFRRLFPITWYKDLFVVLLLFLAGLVIINLRDEIVAKVYAKYNF